VHYSLFNNYRNTYIFYKKSVHLGFINYYLTNYIAKILIMKTKLHWLFIICLLFSAPGLLAQEVENKPQGPVYSGLPTKIEHVPSIASRTNLTLLDTSKKEIPEEMLDGRAWKYDVIPGKGSQGPDVLAQNRHQLEGSIPTRAAELVFQSNFNNNSFPTDPVGAVGPNHYVSAINTGIRIFDKSGNPLTASLGPSSVFGGSDGNYCCDLTVSYDNAADKWIMTILGAGATIAVSDGPDPVNDTWTVYTWGVVSDYQKLSVWSDGYYMTENTGSGNKVHVFERDAMIDAPGAGTTPQIVSFNLPGISTFGFHAPQALNVSTSNLPATGGATIIFQQDDAYGGVTTDHVKLWTIDMDWATIGNSQVSAATQLGIDAGTGTVSPFVSVFNNGSFSNLPQPGGGIAIDALQGLIFNQAQFQKFGTHNSAVFSFVVDVDATAANQAAVRWYELRQSGDNQPWSVFQEGTYIAPDNRNAWNSSLIMDIQGNIGMGYSGMSSPNSADPNVFVGTYYTGRFANDPLGSMTIAEEVIQAGTSNMTTFDRYGDYSKIDLDPSNGKKFWFVNELMASGNRANVVGVFQIAPNTADDVGVISIDTPTDGTLSNSETVTVTVFNFGENAASGFNVTYQVDGGGVISEAFVGTLATQTSAQHTFATTADLSTEGQTYAITSCTALAGDEDTGNDCTTSNVTHIAPNDIGVIAFTSPVSGEGLGNETVTVTIENFGTVAQSGFDVNYSIDAGAPVVETVAATVNPGSTISYSFTATANLTTPGSYVFSSSTLLAGDADGSNDTANTTVTNFSCTTLSNTTAQPVGPNSGDTTTSIISVVDDFVVDDVNVTVNIDHTWDGDLDISLFSPDNTEVVLIAADVNIDGDNFVNTVFDDEAATPITSGSPPFTGSFQPVGSLSDFDGLQTMGDWTLVIVDNFNGDGGTLNSWDLQLCGNMNLSVDEILVEDGITIIYEENNHFLVKLPTNSINERLNMNVFNVLGQNIMWRTLENDSGQGYEYRIDMSHVAAGIYFVKIGNGTRSNIKRIIVK